MLQYREAKGEKMVKIRTSVGESSLDHYKQAEKTLEAQFDLQDFASYLIDYNPEQIKELVEESLHSKGFPEEVKWSDVDWHLQSSLVTPFLDWVKLGVEKEYITEQDIDDNLQGFITSGRAYEMAAKEWQGSQLLRFEVVLNEDIEAWESRMNMAEVIADNFHDLLDYPQIDQIVRENVENYPEVWMQFNDLAKEIGLEEATPKDTYYQIKLNTEDQEEEIAILMTLLLNINAPERINPQNSLSANDFNTLLCVPSLFARLNKQVELLEGVEGWESRNQRVASKRKAAEAIRLKLEDSFDPVVIGSILNDAQNISKPNNPYYRKAEILAEERGLNVEQVLTLRQTVTAKLKGDFANIATSLLDSSLENYETYKKFLSSSQEELYKQWAEQPLINYVDVDIKMQ